MFDLCPVKSDEVDHRQLHRRRFLGVVVSGGAAIREDARYVRVLQRTPG